MFNLQQDQIKEKLASIGFDRIATETGFDSNYNKKIDAYSFLFGFMKMYSHRAHSLSQWAACVAEVNGEPVSKQAIDQRLRARQCACFQKIVAALLSKQYKRSDLWYDFPRVFIQDSTCWSLPASLAEHFPGSHSKTGKAATARLQVCYDLKADQFYEFSLQSFRDNDQKHAGSVQWLRAGDLLIRDLGYFSQHVFADLTQIGAFFVSRLHYRVALYTLNDARITLDKLTRGKRQIDIPVLLGSVKKVKVRLIGFKLPQAQASERKRKAKKKDTRFTPDKKYLKWLEWSFFITNLPADHYSAQQIGHFYRLRWRIEMIFKGFKSGLHWKEVFAYKRLSYERVIITTYIMLIYVILCWRCFIWFYQRESSISLLKFLAWYRLNYQQIIGSKSLDPFKPFVDKLCCYEKRKTRTNFSQLAQLYT